MWSDNLINAIQISIDGLVVVIGVGIFLTAVLFGWMRAHDVALKVEVALGTLRVLVYFFEKDKSRLETILMALPLFGFIFFNLIGADDSLVFVIAYAVGFLVLVVHDYRDWGFGKNPSLPQDLRPPQPAAANGKDGSKPKVPQPAKGPVRDDNVPFRSPNQVPNFAWALEDDLHDIGEPDISEDDAQKFAVPPDDHLAGVFTPKGQAQPAETRPVSAPSTAQQQAWGTNKPGFVRGIPTWEEILERTKGLTVAANWSSKTPYDQEVAADMLYFGLFHNQEETKNFLRGKRESKLVSRLFSRDKNRSIKALEAVLRGMKKDDLKELAKISAYGYIREDEDKKSRQKKTRRGRTGGK